MNPHVAFRFVPLGAEAPAPLPAGEIWVDVGNRVDAGVIDQHAGAAGAWSSAELVLRRFDDGTLAPAAERPSWTVVVHAQPDLDAVCAAWLVRQILCRGNLPEPREALDALVERVSLHDQGFVSHEPPERNWSLVVRTLLDPERAGADDEAVLQAGLEAMERTFRILTGGATLERAASALCDRASRQALMQAQRDYEEDLARGIIFQIRLPVRPLDREPPVPEAGPAPVPAPRETRWSLADGLFLHDPASRLFKELARSDRINSPRGRGFSFLAVSWDPEAPPVGRPLRRYVLSTDPATGLHLQGLGGLLEEREQRLEREASLPALSGRERVAPGTGRHGASVASPWYDGRGHRYTIVDSPSVEAGSRSFCASRLTSAEILETVWDYGDPARFMNLREAEVAVFLPVDRETAWKRFWPKRVRLSSLCPPPDLCDEVLGALDGAALDGALSVYARESGGTVVEGTWSRTGEQLWCFPEGTTLWMGVFRYAKDAATARDLATALHGLRSMRAADLLPGGLCPPPHRPSHHVVHVRLSPAEVQLDDAKGPSAHLFASLAAATPSRFSVAEREEETAGVRRVLSGYRRFLFFATKHGAVAASTRSTPFAAETQLFRPAGLRVLGALALGYRTAVVRIATAFARHRSRFGAMGSGSRVLEDGARLLQTEQVLSFHRVSEHAFGQQVHQAWIEILDVPAAVSDARRKIGVLVEHVREARADFYQRIAFLVTFLFAPLALTMAFFSGIHMDRRFGEKYLTFLPASWRPGGWFLFLTIFLVLAAGCATMWFLTLWSFRRRDPLRRPADAEPDLPEDVSGTADSPDPSPP